MGGPQGSVTSLATDGHFSSDPKYPGRLEEQFPLPIGEAPPTAYWVLDVEADAAGNYDKTLVYACTSELIFKQEWIYLFSRSPSMPAETKDKWMAYMQEKGIDTSGI